MTTDIDAAKTTDMSNVVEDITVAEGSETGDRTYQGEWKKWKGFYDNVPEYAAIVDKKAFWTVGKGWTADAATTKILKRIKGCGKDNFNSILYNWVRVYTLGGDCFSEIVRDKAGRLTNLKPLNPGKMTIQADKFGIIKRYWLEVDIDGEVWFMPFEPKDILHFAWNRLADDIHGTPSPAKLEETFNARKESMDDQRILFHRYVKPINIIYVNSDDDTEIAAFQAKWDKAINKTENIIVPKETVDKVDRISVPQFSTLDPLPWTKLLQKMFVVSEGVPMDYSDSSEAASKIEFVDFHQMVIWNQLFLTREFESQIGLEINLPEPTNLIDDLKEDEKKDTDLNKERKSEVKP